MRRPIIHVSSRIFLVALILLAAWLCLPDLASAQPSGVYQTMGAPPDPKVAAQWNRYHDYADATQLLREMAKAHPEYCRLESLGKSHGGREMWVITISNFAQGKESEKPGFWIDGAIHANEIQAVEVALYTAWYLLEMYGRNPMITRLLDERVFYVLPMMSPDSRDAHMHQPSTTHSPRSGQRPVDDDRDGLFDEDRSDDLDGDGHITQMRIRDPHGRYKSHPDYPDMMIAAAADEAGEFTLLGSEGFDNDGDGKVNEDADGFYDPNRDWAWNWQPRYIQGGAFQYPFSLQENRLVSDFVAAHPNIAGAQSYHNAGGMILRGPGAKDDRYEPADIAVYETIGKKGELMLPGYKLMNVAEELYEVYGGELDWFYAMQGIFTFSNELFTPFNLFRRASEEGFFGREEDLHAFNKYLLFGAGFVPWHEVDHPQYGKVEVGGFTKQWVRQPPSFLLEEECHRNMAFTLYHADQMPKVKVESIQVEPLEDGLVSVTATIVNEKVTPTHAAVDVRHQLTLPDRVTISAPDLKVLLALTDSTRFFNSATEQKRQPRVVRVPNIRGHQAVYVRWIVEGAGPYTVSIQSAKGGVHSLTE